MALSAGTRLGPYEILAPLGAGGMGEVYRARDERLKRDVAVKVLPASFASDPERMRRFEQEAQAAGALNHPNILAIHDVGTVEGSPYLVSELLEGETLRERLVAGPLPARKAIDFAAQIARGLAAAHEKGIVHRDLKPENLFVTRDGRVKILDFGLASKRPLDAAGREQAAASDDPMARHGQTAIATEIAPAKLTEPGVVLGTMGYMSPEQVRGRAADVRSDIFAFGAILYEMLSGKRAFHGDSAADTMSAILSKDPPELSETNRNIPPGLERIVRHCLEKNPEERFHSAHDLAFDLQALSSETSASGRPAVAAAGSPGRRKVPLLWAGAALAIGLVLGGLAAAVFLRKPASEPPTFQRLSFRRGYVWTARFAPDGKTVVYGAAWEGQPVEIFTTSPQSPESRPLGIGSADVLSVSKTGELAVSLNRRFTTGWENTGTLASVPLSGGAPREILENVSEADWAPDGKTLAVVHEVGGKHRLEFPIGKVLYETPGWIRMARVSPKGDRIAFIDLPTRGDNTGSLAVVDLSGRKTSVFERGGTGIAWSPSGDEIWMNTGNAVRAIKLSGEHRVLARVPGGFPIQDVTPDGKVLATLSSIRREIEGLGPGETKPRSLSWLDWSFPTGLSPDGQLLLFEEQNRGDDSGYWVYSRKTDGSPAVRLGEGNTIGLSPDKRWAVAVVGPRSSRQLGLLPVGAGQSRQLPKDAIQYAPWGAWLPDGKRFVVAGVEPGHGVRLYIRDIEGGAARLVTPTEIGVSFTGISVSPDGSSVTTPMQDGTASIVSIADGKARPLPGLAPGESPIGWSEDGRFVFVSQPQGLPAKVFRLDIATGQRSLWKELSPSDPSGVFGVDPIRMTPDGKSFVYSYRRVITDLFVMDGAAR
ncbi:MAG TPA: protein kinase [Thermoanaerobaculia bacterium]|nr:protein kinase [Thermoanaerobaculia bacterium]